MTLQRFKFLKISLPALGILALALFVLPGFSFVLTKAETPPNSTVSEVSMSYNCQDLLLAVKANDLDKVKEIIKTVEPNCSFYNDGEPRSSLVAAARNGNVEIGKVLLAAKAAVEYHAEGDESPLIAAANYGHLDFARMLIDQGAKVNRKVRGDGTALIGAARGGHYEVAKLLLENGADPYLSVSGDEYPMYHAREAGNKPLIKLLASYEK